MPDNKKEINWYIEQGYGDPFRIKLDVSIPLVINAALTGMIPTKEENPYVPITPEEIIEDAVKCFKAGASVLHLHARDANCEPTYKLDVYERVIPKIRKECPGVIICITTSGRKFTTFDCRGLVLNLEGECKPEMATLTLGSMNFPKSASVNAPDMIVQLAKTMAEKGIRPELEVFEVGMINYADYLEKKGILTGPHYFNLFLGSLGTMPGRLKDLDYFIDTLPANSIWSATGIGKFQLPLTIASIIKGGHVRVGLEDNIYFDADRKVLASNEMLVKRLVDFCGGMGRKVAGAKEAREIIGLNSWQRKTASRTEAALNA
jgi:3-keto-5-aminohexanoate cleavage enzyme